jgi:hypothetical protein
MANQNQTIYIHVLVKNMFCFEVDTMTMTIPIDATTNPQRKWGWGHLACLRTLPSKSIGTTLYCLQKPTKQSTLTPLINFIVSKSKLLRQYQHLLVFHCVGPKHNKPRVNVTIINTIRVKVGLEFLRKSIFGCERIIV